MSKDDDGDRVSDKFLAKFGRQVGKDAGDLVGNLRANFNVKHKGNLDELKGFLKKKTTKRDWVLSQMAFSEDALADVDDEYFQRLSDLVDDNFKFDMHHIEARNPVVGAANLDFNKDLRFIEMLDETTGDLTIVFAGLGEGAETKLVGERAIDTLFRKTDFVYGEGKVSRPIFEIYDNLRPTILEVLSKHDPKKVKFVGHSLGGALAEMAGADLDLGISNKTVTAFAPPPFGDAKFAEMYPGINLNRIGNKYDPVMFKLGFGSRHPTSDMWDITNVDSKLLNDDFWKSPGKLSDDLVSITHRSGGLEDSFNAVLFDSDLLETSVRTKGDSVFNSKVLNFLDTLDLGLKASTDSAVAAFKEFFKASGGDTPYFKGVFSGDAMEKVGKVITIDNINLDVPALADLADFDVIDATNIAPFDDITTIPGLEDLELEDITTKIGSVVDELDTSKLLKGINLSDRLTPAVKPVLKNITASLSENPTLKAGRSVVKGMAKRVKSIKGAMKGFKPGVAKSIAAMTKSGIKAGAKGIAKAIDVGVLDAVFIGIDIADDYDRIDDESVYTMWNGVPVHKLYNPEEYAYIEALKAIYRVTGGPQLGIAEDNFVNTWFGRVSESDDGTLMIDGEPSNFTEFSDKNSYLSVIERSSEGLQLESKTSAVVENTAKGVLGFFIGAALFTAAAVAAPATGGASLVAAGAVYATATAATVGASVALEEIDSHYENKQIGERANNFNQAFQKKIINDHLDNLNFKIIEVFGPLLSQEHSVTWHRELLTATLLKKSPKALKTLVNWGYPKSLLESVGKIVRSHVQRIDSGKITAETKFEDIVSDTTERLNLMQSYFAAEFKVQREMNKKLDDLYKDLQGDVNGDLNLLWETVTDVDSGLKEEEIEDIIKKANKIVAVKHKHSRDDRNKLLEDASEDLKELLESTEDKVEDRKDFQKEIDKLNKEISKIKDALEKERENLKESAGELEDYAASLREGAEDLTGAREKILKAQTELKEARGEILEAREDLAEDRESLLEAANEINRQRQEILDYKIAEREKEFQKIQTEQAEKIEGIQKKFERREQQRNQKTSVESAVNLNQAALEADDLNYDRGLPDVEDEERFAPTGRELAFTFDSGPPRMLFEDGKEKTYTGPTNALSGGITQGNWTGVIPNGNKPPINLLDNYFMAYHIENQTDQAIANGRLVKRLTRALNMKKFTPEKNPLEYRVALITLEHIKRYKNVYGIEISNSFMENGLGAVIRDQVFEQITTPLKKGALPATFSLGEENLDFNVDADSKITLKRARDIAFAGGDKMMGMKFQRVQKEMLDMERVAGEYITAAKEFSSSGNVSLGMDRLVLENVYKTEEKEETIAKMLISVLNKPLIQVIQQ